MDAEMDLADHGAAGESEFLMLTSEACRITSLK